MTEETFFLPGIGPAKFESPMERAKSIAFLRHRASYVPNKETGEECEDINPRLVQIDNRDVLICDDCKAILLRWP